MSVRTEARTEAHGGERYRDRASQVPRRTASLRAAYVLSAGIAALMMAASVAGLLVNGLYPDGAWAREAFRAADLVTLVLAAPLLIASLVLSSRGSRPAQVVWIAMLGYALYNYAYAVFGAKFNDVFLAHIAIFSMSIFALACTLPNLDLRVGARVRTWKRLRWIGGFLILVGLGQGGLWAFLLMRFAFTGELLNDIPVAGQHLVFALDLSLLVPALVVAGILLYRRTAAGFFMGSAVAVFGAVYQVNLNMAAVFGEMAGVPGVKAFPLEGIIFVAAFALVAVVLMRSQQRANVA